MQLMTNNTPLQYHGSKFWYNKGHLKVSETVVFPWDLHYNVGEMRKLWIKQESKSPVRPEHPRLPDFLSVGSVVEQIGVVSLYFTMTFKLSNLAPLVKLFFANIFQKC